MFGTRIANRTARGMAVGALILSLGATTFGGSANAAPLADETQGCSVAAHARNDAVHLLHTAWKAFDGDLNTRWNGYTGTGEGTWLAAQWDSPVTFNQVVVREYADRIDGFRVQRFDTAANDWVLSGSKPEVRISWIMRLRTSREFC